MQNAQGSQLKSGYRVCSMISVIHFSKQWSAVLTVGCYNRDTCCIPTIRNLMVLDPHYIVV